MNVLFYTQNCHIRQVHNLIIKYTFLNIYYVKNFPNENIIGRGFLLVILFYDIILDLSSNTSN